VRNTECDRLRALVAKDMDVANKLHADDFQLINPMGLVATREEYLGGVASGEVDHLWEPDGSIQVRLHGLLALIRYRSRVSVVFRGQPVPARGAWHTDAYEKRDGQWQVVWSHATALQDDLPR